MRRCQEIFTNSELNAPWLSACEDDRKFHPIEATNEVETYSFCCSSVEWRSVSQRTHHDHKSQKSDVDDEHGLQNRVTLLVFLFLLGTSCLNCCVKGYCAYLRDFCLAFVRGIPNGVDGKMRMSTRKHTNQPSFRNYTLLDCSSTTKQHSWNAC